MKELTDSFWANSSCSARTCRVSPQEKNPRGEVHEDWLVISYDRAKKNFMARGVFIESYVIRYALDLEASTEKRLVFLSEAVENGPRLRARLTYQIQALTDSITTSEKDPSFPSFPFLTSWVRMLPVRWLNSVRGSTVSGLASA